MKIHQLLTITAISGDLHIVNEQIQRLPFKVHILCDPNDLQSPQGLELLLANELTKRKYHTILTRRTDGIRWEEILPRIPKAHLPTAILNASVGDDNFPQECKEFLKSNKVKLFSGTGTAPYVIESAIKELVHALSNNSANLITPSSTDQIPTKSLRIDPLSTGNHKNLIVGAGNQALEIIKQINSSQSIQIAEHFVWNYRSLPLCRAQALKEAAMPNSKVTIISGEQQLYETLNENHFSIFWNTLPYNDSPNSKRPITKAFFSKSFLELLGQNTAIVSVSNTDNFNLPALANHALNHDSVIILDGLGRDYEGISAADIKESPLYPVIHDKTRYFHKIRILKHSLGSSLEAETTIYLSVLIKWVSLFNASNANTLKIIK